jgi:hypothetical protein
MCEISHKLTSTSDVSFSMWEVSNAIRRTMLVHPKLMCITYLMMILKVTSILRGQKEDMGLSYSITRKEYAFL